MKMEKALVDSSCVSRLSSSEVAVEKLNICSISHRPLANAILEAVGGSVKSLAIREFPFELIPTCATGLQELKVMGGGYSRAEEDEFSAQIWETGDMWEAVGPTLEVFVCYIQGMPKVPLEKMKMFCRKLQSISVCPHFYAMNALTDLLVSCGERLRFTDVDALSAGDLQIVLSACPNMQANYDGNRAGMVMGGDRFKRVCFVAFDLSDVQDMADASECRNAETLGLVAWDGPHRIGGLKSKDAVSLATAAQLGDKPLLQSLHLCLFPLGHISEARYAARRRQLALLMQLQQLIFCLRSSTSN